MGVPKIPTKIFIFEEILKGTSQLSVEHSIFHLELIYVGVRRRAVVLNPVHHITHDLGCCQEQKAYTFQLLPYKN